MSLDTVFVQKLSRAFPSGQEPAIAHELLNYLKDRAQVRHISLDLIRQIAARKTTDAELFRTLQFLAGADVGLLRAKFEYVDDEGELVDLSDDEVRTCLATRTSPLSGHDDPNVEQRILIYFEPDADAVRALFGATPTSS